MTRPTRLGKGISALIGEYADREEGETMAADAPPEGPAQTLSLSDIRPNPSQPRRHFDVGELEALAASIAAKGVVQPILVRPDPDNPGGYQIVAGERRYRAAGRAGLPSIPAVVRDLNDLEVLEIAIVENVQRTNLNPMEEAEAYQALVDRFGRTQQAIADAMGKSRVHVANTLRLLTLPEDVRTFVREGALSPGHARACLQSDSPSALASFAVEQGLSVRETEKAAQRGANPLETKSMGGSYRGDPDIAALEADLERRVGLPVSIASKSNGTGKITFSYSKLEQLDDLCGRLSKSDDD